MIKKLVIRNQEYNDAQFELVITRHGIPVLTCPPQPRFKTVPPPEVFQDHDKWIEWARGNYVPPYIFIAKP